MGRASARSRGYTPDWDRTAATFKARHPWCLGCEAIGIAKRATVVDHIQPHKGNTALFWCEANWQPACGWHHDSIKKQLETLFLSKRCTLDDLRLDSAKAIALSKATVMPPKSIGGDGWPVL